MSIRRRALSFFFWLCAVAPQIRAEPRAIAVLANALAPNAGGQEAYSLMLAGEQHEGALFFNRSLLAGGVPLVGGVYRWRFPVCGMTCIWQFYLDGGGGVSNAGPLLEIGWSTIVLWLARVDFRTQFYFSKTRLITWNYPLWLGLSVPISF